MSVAEATDLRQLHLRRDGVSVVLDVPAAGLPRVVHWGADLGPLTGEELAAAVHAGEPAVPRNALDERWPLTLLPTQGEGWLGHPGLSAHREGRALYPRWVARVEDVTEHGLTVVAREEDDDVELRSVVVLRPGGLLGIRHTVTNTGASAVEIGAVRTLLPVPDLAAEVLDLTGRWAKERVPQRAPLRFGAQVRESRRGRTGHDAATMLLAGTAGFANRSGQVWGVHVATSGNHVHLLERLPEGAGGAAGVLGGGELLEPGEMVLAPGAEYSAPWVWFSWSDGGLDGAARRVHRHLRERPQHPVRPRPLVLNTWEAVYLDHDPARLMSLATLAADVGVERFVLDDGWFHGRPGTVRTGLGDWWVDASAWPAGLGELSAHVRGLGMEFGLWFEPEMVNPDSELVRRHPEWVLARPGRWPRTSRHQLALDVARPEVADYLFGLISSLVAEYEIAYLKWDHNRDLHEPVHLDSAGVHRQTLAAYALMDRLKAAHPGLEIEACASGGARVDLQAVTHADRVWTSDTNDPLERQRIQRWTQQLLPLELQGTHIGPPRAHTTGRATSLQFRALTALFGHAGIEWDIAECTPDELAVLRAWSALYRELRPLLHSGELVHVDHPDPDVLLTGVVAADRSHAVYTYARLDTSVAATGDRLRLAGLDDDATYAVRVREDLGAPDTIHVAPPPWLSEGVTLPGRVLREVGLAVPQLNPQSAVLLELRRV